MAPKDPHYLANLARTEKARTQLAVNRATSSKQKRRATESDVSSKGNLLAHGTADPDSYSARLSKTFFSSDLRRAQQTERYAQNTKLYENDRARCVYSVIKAFASMVVTVMEGQQPKHVPELLHVRRLLNSNAGSCWDRSDNCLHGHELCAQPSHSQL